MRYFNPVGAHNSALIGELPLGVPQNLVPFITQTAAGLRNELKVFGDDYNTPDGSAVRDYIHVVDLAKAHVLCGQKLENRSGIHIYNVGLGEGKTVKEVVDAFLQEGFEFNYEFGARREGDAAESYCDNSKIVSEFGWKPQLGIKDMVSSTISYFRNTNRGVGLQN